jgi:glycosyltransferase involved in cell wall biosynthesis
MAKALMVLGIPESKIHLTRYGVDPARFEEKSVHATNPVFFGVGRFVDKKAPYLTLLAFAKAREHLPEAKLILGGTGELLEATRNIALALHLGDSVEFPGVLPPEAVATRMRGATAFVQHSLEPAAGPAAGDREGTPVAVLEAMMTGLPTISTRHAGIGEVIEHNRTGLLVEERDVDAMAEAMVTLATSPGLAARLGKAARAEALAKYTADHYLNSLRKVLEAGK